MRLPNGNITKEEVLDQINALNNVLIETVPYDALLAFNIKGSKFAIERATEIVEAWNSDSRAVITRRENTQISFAIKFN